MYLPQCLQKAAKLLPFFLLWVCFCSVWEAEKRCDWKVKKSKRSSVLFLFRWALENAGSSTHLIDKTCTIYIQVVFKRGSLWCVSCHLNYLQPCAWSLLYARAISQYLKKLCVCPLSVGDYKWVVKRRWGCVAERDALIGRHPRRSWSCSCGCCP